VPDDLKKIVATALDAAWDGTPVERDYCCAYFADAAISAVERAGYVIVKRSLLMHGPVSRRIG
jgi:hypothetical protein